MIAYDFVEVYGIEIKQGHVLLSMEIKAAKCRNVDIMTCFCKIVGKYGEYCQYTPSNHLNVVSLAGRWWPDTVCWLGTELDLRSRFILQVIS